MAWGGRLRVDGEGAEGLGEGLRVDGEGLRGDRQTLRALTVLTSAGFLEVNSALLLQRNPAASFSSQSIIFSLFSL